MVTGPRTQCFAERRIEEGRMNANQIHREFVLWFVLAMVVFGCAEISYQVEVSAQKCDEDVVVVD